MYSEVESLGERVCNEWGDGIGEGEEGDVG